MGRLCFGGAGFEACVSNPKLFVMKHHDSHVYSRNALPKFEVAGGLVSGTEESRGVISLDRPNRQWGAYFWGSSGTC